MNPTQSKIIDQVDESAIVNLASELIKIPSFKVAELRRILNILTPRIKYFALRAGDPVAAQDAKGAAGT
jgi:hypothetical protein